MIVFVYLHILYNLLLHKSQAHFTKIKFALDSVTEIEFMISVSKAKDEKKIVLDRNKKFVIICKKYGKGALEKADFAFFILRKSAKGKSFLICIYCGRYHTRRILLW